MNNSYLLDTQILIWWLIGNRRLTAKVKQVIESPDNLIYYSVASLWEISIKQMGGKLSLKISLEKIADAIPFETLTIKKKHILILNTLAYFHKDPFDRILISQALYEKATLITADKKITKYQVPVLLP